MSFPGPGEGDLIVEQFGTGSWPFRAFVAFLLNGIYRPFS